MYEFIIIIIIIIIMIMIMIVIHTLLWHCVMIESTRWINEIYKSDMIMWYSKQAQNKYILW